MGVHAGCPLRPSRTSNGKPQKTLAGPTLVPWKPRKGSRLRPNDVVGEVAFSLRARYQSDVVCLRRARVLLVPADTVRVFLERNPMASAQLAFDLGAQVRRLMRLVEDLSSGSVERRLARVLVRLAERASQPFPGGILVPMRLRRADLAALAATTVESVSRRISVWRSREWVVPQPAGYLIRDLQALGRVANERT